MHTLALFIGSLAVTASATISLSSLQPITQFSDACTAAYNSPISNCDGVAFAPFQSKSSCTQSCFNELNDLATRIQSQCQGAAARPDTVIGHAFTGDLGSFLCAVAQYASTTVKVGSGTATNLYATSSSLPASTVSAIATSASSTATASTATASTATASTATASTATASTATASTATASTAITKSSKPAAATATMYDSTPFDQIVQSGAAVTVYMLPKVSALLGVLQLLVVGGSTGRLY